MHTSSVFHGLIRMAPLKDWALPANSLNTYNDIYKIEDEADAEMRGWPPSNSEQRLAANSKDYNPGDLSELVLTSTPGPFFSLIPGMSC